jgi:hypothetical protein
VFRYILSFILLVVGIAVLASGSSALGIVISIMGILGMILNGRLAS